MHVVFLILKLLFLILKSRIAVLPKPKHSGESDKACSQRQVPDRESELFLPLERLYFFSMKAEEAAAFCLNYYSISMHHATESICPDQFDKVSCMEK